MRAQKSDIGKRVVFRATTRYSDRKATRVIKGIIGNGNIVVSYAGWSDFQVYPHEIIEILEPHQKQKGGRVDG